MAMSNTLRDNFKLSDYTHWYRLAEEVFGNLIPQLSDEKIAQLTPKKGYWFPIPLFSETEIKDVANRPDPHIDFKIGENETIRIGMRCNTIASVEKMRNILNEMQTVEKQEFLVEMGKLDDGFQTQVLVKIKEINFSHIDGYECKFIAQSNKIDDQVIHQVFHEVDTIREEGTRRLKEEQLRLNPETPVLDITFVTIKQDSNLFKQKLSQMKRMYQICIGIKTATELRAEKKKLEKNLNDQWIIKYRCSKCGKEYASSKEGLRFCDQDGMRIIAVKERKES
ncbi:MAG: hypothetical protein ABSB10_08180 [Candidatus Bathyarchaeia archaeon]|jgi:DNA-directed RNA polymerase subunit RPC12/RpoP